MGFKIYTKTGDKGETGLLGGARVPKTALRIEAYGTVDELNAFAGALADQSPKDLRDIYLSGIQDELFIIGSHLARDPQKKDIPIPEFPEDAIGRLETLMDEMDAQLDPLKNFILPGGHLTVSYSHICRTICRRAERRVIGLSEHEEVETWIIQYLNRLSDFFFMYARFLAKRLNVEERPWIPGK